MNILNAIDHYERIGWPEQSQESSLSNNSQKPMSDDFVNLISGSEKRINREVVCIVRVKVICRNYECLLTVLLLYGSI